MQGWGLLRAVWRKGSRSEEGYKTLGRKALRWGKASVASAKIDRYMPAASGSHQSLRRIDQVGSNPLAGTRKEYYDLTQKQERSPYLPRTQEASSEAVYRVFGSQATQRPRQENLGQEAQPVYGPSQKEVRCTCNVLQSQWRPCDLHLAQQKGPKTEAYWRSNPMRLSEEDARRKEHQEGLRREWSQVTAIGQQRFQEIQSNYHNCRITQEEMNLQLNVIRDWMSEQFDRLRTEGVR